MTSRLGTVNGKPFFYSVLFIRICFSQKRATNCSNTPPTLLGWIIRKILLFTVKLATVVPFADLRALQDLKMNMPTKLCTNLRINYPFKRIWICDLRVEITAFFLSSRPRKESKCPVLWLVVSSAFPQIRPIGMNYGENKTNRSRRRLSLNISNGNDLVGGGTIFLISALIYYS